MVMMVRGGKIQEEKWDDDDGSSSYDGTDDEKEGEGEKGYQGWRRISRDVMPCCVNACVAWFCLFWIDVYYYALRGFS